VLRYYLTIGFTAWLGLAVLASTSNDYMVRQLGGIRWRHVHWLVYPIAVLGSFIISCSPSSKSSSRP
jgi:sulfoxide reductase heme-binding subunit YedZ